MKTPFLVACLFVAARVGAQNLVPNGSFEDFTLCPTTGGQVANAIGWETPYLQSADYFNACAAGGLFGVPLNVTGDQEPAEGFAYMGLIVYVEGDPTNQEQIAVELNAPLQPGALVHVCFKAAQGGFGLSPGSAGRYACKGVGAKFFATWPLDDLWWNLHFQPPQNDPVVYLDVVPVDTSIWYDVSGSFIADSAYTHLVIGNFLDETNSEVTLLDSINPLAGYSAYMFIDEVVVSYSAATCSPESVAGYRLSETFSVWPNPNTGNCTVRSDALGHGVSEWVLMDAEGRTISRSPIHGEVRNEFTLTTEGLPSGIYLLQVTKGSEHTTLRINHLSP